MDSKDLRCPKKYTEEPTDINECIISLPVFLAVNISLEISYLFISVFLGFAGFLVVLFLFFNHYATTHPEFLISIKEMKERVIGKSHTSSLC